MDRDMIWQTFLGLSVVGICMLAGIGALHLIRGACG